jgi:hypothetical protein
VNFYSEAAAIVSDALSDESAWKAGHYTLDHKSGLRLWMGNGAWFFDVYEPNGGAIGLLERHFLYRKARALVRKLAVASLKRVPLSQQNGQLAQD